MTELFELSAPHHARTPTWSTAAPAGICSCPTAAGSTTSTPRPGTQLRRAAARRRRARADATCWTGSASTRRRTSTTPRCRAAGARAVPGRRAEVQPRLHLLLRRRRQLRRPGGEHAAGDRAGLGRPAVLPGRRRGAGQPRLPRRRAAAQPPGASAPPPSAPATVAAERGVDVTLLDHHQRHPADRRRRRLLRGARLRRDGQPGRPRAGARPAAALPRRPGQLRPHDHGPGRAAARAGSGGCRSRPGSRSPRPTSACPRRSTPSSRSASTASASRRCCARPTGARRARPAPSWPPCWRRWWPAGQEFERRVIAGERYPFANAVTAMRELHRGTHRPYPCGAGAGYLGVAADGALAACHRFVGDPEAALRQRDRRASTAAPAALAGRAARAPPGAVHAAAGPATCAAAAATTR